MPFCQETEWNYPRDCGFYAIRVKVSIRRWKGTRVGRGPSRQEASFPLSTLINAFKLRFHFPASFSNVIIVVLAQFPSRKTLRKHAKIGLPKIAWNSKPPTQDGWNNSAKLWKLYRSHEIGFWWRLNFPALTSFFCSCSGKSFTV